MHLFKCIGCCLFVFWRFVLKLKNWLLTVTLLTSPLAYGQYCGTDVGSINTPNNHFSLLNNGTVVHKKTGLTLFRCPALSGDWTNRVGVYLVRIPANSGWRFIHPDIKEQVVLIL